MNSAGTGHYPALNLKTDTNFTIKILDNMIQVEEDMKNGFSVFSRGNRLKKCLINPERVRQYLQGVRNSAKTNQKFPCRQQ